ncbi:hypothetical protein QOZ80_3AG0242530 [Eleusine coracana subsp. coracana]|nr:hypothetical protein QOZ80_3AG0242530 [Eleusine coracana subsp. coracana]
MKKKKAAEGSVGMGDQSRVCLAVSLSMQLTVTLAFLACVAFFPNGNASGRLYQWWRSQAHSVRLGNVSADDAATGGVRAPTTLSHIMFGIGSSARTWDKRRGYAELWWRPGQMRGHVWLEQEPPAGKWPATSPTYRVSSENRTRFGRKASASRMARIVADSFLAVTTAELRNNDTAAAREDEVRWFVMGDDDTVFFPDNLVSVLRKYDHQEMYYVGAPSESVEQDQVHQYGTAFGGGGIAISYPAAAELTKAIDGCLDRYEALYGSDERVHACLSELGIPLTREPGFHQMDIRGDAYGMLAAHPVAPLVSLHHLDRVQPINPQGKTPVDALRPLVDASKFDPARILQQSICYQQGPGYNWSVSVAWGYTAQIYPWTVAAREMETPLLTFKTWQRKANGPFVFNTRRWVPDNACARPAIFFLSLVRNDTGGGATVTEYARHHEEKEKECDEPSFRAASVIRTVRVLSPTMSPSEWERAPRRHCCEVGKTVQGSVLEVQIRRCGRGEIATAT